MDNDEALLALAYREEDPNRADKAKDHLADRYLDRLLSFLIKTCKVDEGVALTAAGKTLYELFRGVSADVGFVSTESDGIWRWLISAVRYRVIDETRRLGRITREHSYDGVPTEPPSVAPTDPKHLLENKERAEAALRWVFAQEQPTRGILLFDVVYHLDELASAVRELHDQELIDCSQKWEGSSKIYTRDMLRSHRTRARKRLTNYLEGLGL